MDFINNIPVWVTSIVIPLAIMLIDFFLGQTSIVKPNSIVAIILEVLKKIASLFKKPDNSTNPPSTPTV